MRQAPGQARRTVRPVTSMAWVRGAGDDLRALADSAHRRVRHRDDLPGDGSMVLLVHGHLGHPSDLGMLAARMHARGHRVNAVRRSPRQRVDPAVAQLGRLMEAIPGQVHLIGHSLGGIIVARLLLDHPARVLSATALAAPLAGAPLAALSRLKGNPVHDVAPGSAALPDLHRLEALSGRLLLVAAGQDPIVPLDSALGCGMPARSVVVPSGHIGILRDPSALSAVEEHVRALDREMRPGTRQAPCQG